MIFEKHEIDTGTKPNVALSESESFSDQHSQSIVFAHDISTLVYEFNYYYAFSDKGHALCSFYSYAITMYFNNRPI